MRDESEVPWRQLTTTQKRDRVKQYADQNLSAGQIAQILGVTRNAIIGVVHRHRQTLRLRGTPGKLRRQSYPRNHPARVAPKKPPRGTAPPKTVIQASRAARARLLEGAAWEPLEGSTPVLLVDRDPRGCAWPVTVAGKTLFCNCSVPAFSSVPYCPAHRARYSKVYGVPDK